MLDWGGFVFEALFIGVIVILVVVLGIVLFLFFEARSRLAALSFSKASQSVKYGQLAEQWIPFSAKFPYNSQNFRFIGKPIDGICFEDDKVVFVEFKTNKSSLNESQKKVRDLVERKRVEWLEFRVD